MNYLFLDLEFANCFNATKKICEVGYIQTNEQLEVISKKQMIINPDSPFDWFALKNLFSYTKEEYLQQEKYPYYFEDIKKIITEEDQVVIGQNIKGDIQAFNCESRRYNLPTFTFKAYDLGEIFKRSENYKYGIEKMLEYLKISFGEKLHNAQNDALATLFILKALCEKCNMTAKELLRKNGTMLVCKDGKIVRKSSDKVKEKKCVVSISEIMNFKQRK